MLKTHAGVIAFHDITEVIDEGFHGGIILVIDVLRLFQAEGALLQLGVRALLLLLLAVLHSEGVRGEIRCRGSETQ